MSGRRNGQGIARRTAAGALLISLSGIGPFSLHSQAEQAVDSPPAAERPSPRGWLGDAPASPLLPPGHWAVRAAARAEAMGLADNYLPAQEAVPRAVVFAVLAHADAMAADRPGLARLTAGWVARFREEFREYGEDATDALVFPLNGRVSPGFADEKGRLSPAIGYYVGERNDPELVPPVSTPRLEMAAVTGDRRHLAAFALGRWDDAGVDVARWEGVAAAGPVSVSIGRQPVRYGWGEGGTVVLTDALVPRVEAQTLRPVRLPSVLRHFGGVTLHTFVSPLGGRRHPDEPWLWGARLAFQPHRRLTFAVNRASIFGGDTSITPGRLLGMFVGVIEGSQFENQVLGLEGRWRLPTDAVLPVTAYLEWGADDGAGGLDEVPARVGGIFLPALPGVPEVSAGAEYAQFADVCCGHGPWYFNSTHPGNWARGTRPLAHPLGGQGWEAAAYAGADLLSSRLRLYLRGFARDRSDAEITTLGGGNLFSPQWTGRSTGVRAEAAYRLSSHADLRAAARRESGDGWSERAFDAAVSVFF